jgi:hypothetical protein
VKRRDFISLLGGAAAAWPLAARAQQATMPVIGLLGAGSPEPNAKWIMAARQGLSETGHVEGRNVTIEYHWAEGRYDRLPAMAADLVQRNRALIFADALPVALVARYLAKKAIKAKPQASSISSYRAFLRTNMPARSRSSPSCGGLISTVIVSIYCSPGLPSPKQFQKMSWPFLSVGRGWFEHCPNRIYIAHAVRVGGGRKGIWPKAFQKSLGDDPWQHIETQQGRTHGRSASLQG